MTSRFAFVSLVFLFSSSAACAVFQVLCPVAVTAADSRPNVLFLIVDDLRPELGCYGSAHVTSPHIDELASRSLLFERAYCQQAHCVSSRFSLLTGCRPDTAGIWTNRDVREQLREIPFLPAYFREQGYETVGFGKISHNSWEDPASWSEPHRMPENAPYEYRTRAGRALVERMQEEAAAAGRPDPFAGVPEKIRRGLPFESLEVGDSELGDGQIADAAIGALERLRDRPFFLGVGFLRPHLPFVAPRRYWDLYDPETLPAVPQNVALPGLPGLSHDYSRELRTQYREVPVRGPLSDDFTRDLWHGYLACVSYIDAQIGRILAALERFELEERTIIVLVSDHGFHLGESGTWGKATNFEAATRTVLVIRAPGMAAAGARTDSLVELVGLYPSLCDLAGLPRPDHLQGESFASLLEDPALTPVEAAFSQYARGGSMGRSVRTDRYRYVEWRRIDSGDLAGRELYDHDTDPKEKVNLADDPESHEIMARLAAMLPQMRADGER